MNRCRSYFWVALALALHAGLAPAAPISSATSGFWTNPATWTPAQVPTAADAVTILNTHTITNSDVLVHDAGSLTINSGGALTHTVNSTLALGERYKAILNIAGDLTIAAGGQIHADVKGYSAYNGPGIYIAANAGSSHGGIGGMRSFDVASARPGPTYGSVTAPTNLGTGGVNYPGGGAVILTVNGTTILGGLISANGINDPSKGFGGASGGSVYLRTAHLTGSGTIRANAEISAWPQGGGGRVAVILTGDTSFGNVQMQAFSGTGPSRGGAGTVYLQTQPQGSGKGTLVINANNLVPELSSLSTLIGSNVTDAVVGDVVITNRGILQIGTDQTLTVNGSWTNAGTFLTGGTVLFAGADPATVYGSNAFYNLTCTTAGKVLSFQTNSITTIAPGGMLTLTGASGNPITVQSAAAGTKPKLMLFPGSLQALAYVAAQDSDASGGDAVMVPTGTDLGGNLNWYFTGGQAITWTGAASTNWATDSNWSPARRPTYLDTVIIPNTARKPSLDANRVVAGLTNQAGAVLNLNGGNLTVSGRVRNAGAIAASAGETLTLNGDADFTGGTFTPQASTVVLGGALAQSFTPGGNTFNDITVADTNGAVTFQDGFTARNLLLCGANTFSGAFTVKELRCTLPGSSLVFHNGATYAATSLTLIGAAGNPVMLRSAASGSAWNLNLGGASAIEFVDVKDSNAAGGRTVYAFNSTDSGANPNWDFGAWKIWTGGTSVDFANGLNWSGGVAPGPADRVLIDGDYVRAPRITAATTVGLLNVGITTPSTLTVDAVLTVAGDATVGQYGVLTHTVNSTTAAGELYKIIMNVANVLTIAVGGQISADGKGYAGPYGPAPGRAGAGAGHGGVGGTRSTAALSGTTYGSVIAPTNLGSGGCYGDDHGGGAIKLTVLGTTAVHGAISAAGTYGGGPYYGPAGGSVFLTTRSLTGAGTIGANGTIYKPNGDSPGGGGRVAVILTGSTDIGDVKLQAYTGTNKYGGAGGTVYLEHTGHTPGQGKLIVDYNDIPPMDRTGCITLQNGAAESSYTFSEIILTNGGVYALDTNDALTVTSATTIRGDPADGYDGIYIWGALNLPPVFTSYSNYFIAINASDAAFNPGPSLTVITNSILRVNAPFTLNCPLTIAPGGVMDHSYNSSLEVFKINLVINGDLDIQAGGEINVDGKGYYAQYGPGKPGANSGAGYGGMGGHHNTAGTFPGTTYGSITAPTNIGSGGYDANSYGGGAVILAVNGATTLNGMILARPASAAIGYQGSGGSVFLTTDTLTGSGTINAGSIAGAVGTGGGGRVAVILTDGNDFGNIVMTAYSAIASHVPGAPGTVYTQTMDQGPGGGALVINASNIISAVVSSTLINSNVTDCMVGTVLITNAAKLRIDTNQTLAVNRDWINAGGTNLSFIANTGSTVIMGSTNTATVSGSNTFYNLTCTNSGKTVRFTAGTTNFVTAQLALGPRVALESTVDNSWWYLTLDPGGTQQIKSVAVQDSNAGGGQELVAPKGSVDLGNNVNWMFQRYAGTVFRGQ